MKYLGLLLICVIALLVFQPEAQAQSFITNLWEKSAGDFDFFAADNNTRGMAYNPVTDHLLIASRTGGSVVYILDAATGDSLDQLDMTGVSGGTFAINIPRVDESGVIYVANLAGILTRLRLIQVFDVVVQKNPVHS